VKVYAFLSIRKYLEKEERFQIFMEMYDSPTPTKILKSHLILDNIADKQLINSVFYVLDY